MPREKRIITVKIPLALANQRTLKDIENLAGKAFGENCKSFVTRHAITGFVYVSWFFPERPTAELERLAHENDALFRQEGVEEVIVAGRTVFLCEQKGEKEVRIEVLNVVPVLLFCCLLLLLSINQGP